MASMSDCMKPRVLPLSLVMGRERGNQGTMGVSFNIPKHHMSRDQFTPVGWVVGDQPWQGLFHK